MLTPWPTISGAPQPADGAIRALSRQRWGNFASTGHEPSAAVCSKSRISPGQAATGEMGQRVDVLGVVHVPRWSREGGVGRDADRDPPLVPAHLLDLGALRLRHLLAGHQVDDPRHDVDGQAEVLLELGVAVHLEVREGPLLIEDADADLRAALHG